MDHAESSVKTPRLKCGACASLVLASDIADGRAVWKDEQLLCPTCISDARGALAEAVVAANLPRMKPLACTRCDASVTIRNIYTTAVGYHRGKLYCQRCRRDVPTLLQDALGFAKPDLDRAADADPDAWAFCGACGDGIGHEDIVRGNARGIEGHLLCARCSGAMVAMLRETEATLARLPTELTVDCVDCGVEVPLRDIVIETAQRHGDGALCSVCTAARLELEASASSSGIDDPIVEQIAGLDLGEPEPARRARPMTEEVEVGRVEDLIELPEAEAEPEPRRELPKRTTSHKFKQWKPKMGEPEPVEAEKPRPKPWPTAGAKSSDRKKTVETAAPERPPADDFEPVSIPIPASDDDIDPIAPPPREKKRAPTASGVAPEPPSATDLEVISIRIPGAADVLGESDLAEAIDDLTSSDELEPAKGEPGKPAKARHPGVAPEPASATDLEVIRIRIPDADDVLAESGLAAPFDPGAKPPPRADDSAIGLDAVISLSPSKTDPELEPISVPIPSPELTAERAEALPKCANCGAMISKAAEASGRTVTVAGALFCPKSKCLEVALQLQNETDTFLRSVHRTMVACTRCRKTTPIDDAADEGWIWQDDDPYCAEPECRKVALAQRRRELKQTGELEIPSDADVDLEVPPEEDSQAAATAVCALCGRREPSGEATADWVTLGEDLFCASCRAEAERLMGTANQALQEGLPSCAGCGNLIDAAAIRAKAITKIEGKIYCDVCSSDVHQVLAKMRAGVASNLAPCPACGGKIPFEDRENDRTALFRGGVFCIHCGPTVEEMRAETEWIARKLGGRRAPCSVCETLIKGREMDATNAVFFRKTLFCGGCHSKALLAIGEIGRAARKEGIADPTAFTAPEKPRDCAACARPIDPEGRIGEFHGFQFCSRCVGHLEALKEETFVASRVPYANGLPCFECGERVAASEIRSEQAVSYQGYLYCPRCRSAAFEQFGAEEDPDHCYACGNDAPSSPPKLRRWTFCWLCADGMVVSVLEETRRLLKEGLPEGKRCFKCDALIQQEDLEKNRVVVRNKKVFCPSCADPMVLTVVYGARRAAVERGAPKTTARRAAVAAPSLSSLIDDAKNKLNLPREIEVSVSRHALDVAKFFGTLLVALACLSSIVVVPIYLTRREEEKPKEVFKMTKLDEMPVEPPKVPDPPPRIERFVPEGQDPRGAELVVNTRPEFEDRVTPRDLIRDPNNPEVVIRRPRRGDPRGGDPSQPGGIRQPPRPPAGGAAQPGQPAGRPGLKPVEINMTHMRISPRTVTVYGNSKAPAGTSVQLTLYTRGADGAEKPVDHATTTLDGASEYVFTFGPYATTFAGQTAIVEARLIDRRITGYIRGELAGPPANSKPPPVVWPRVAGRGIPVRLRSQSWRFEKTKRGAREDAGQWRYLSLDLLADLKITPPSDSTEGSVRIELFVKKAEVIRDARGERGSTAPDVEQTKKLVHRRLKLLAKPDLSRAWFLTRQDMADDVRLVIARALAHTVPAPLNPGGTITSTRRVEADIDLVGSAHLVPPKKGDRLWRLETVLVMRTLGQDSEKAPPRAEPIKLHRESVRMGAMRQVPRSSKVVDRLQYKRPIEVFGGVVRSEREVWDWCEDLLERLDQGS